MRMVVVGEEGEKWEGLKEFWKLKFTQVIIKKSSKKAIPQVFMQTALRDSY